LQIKESDGVESRISLLTWYLRIRHLYLMILRKSGTPKIRVVAIGRIQISKCMSYLELNWDICVSESILLTKLVHQTWIPDSDFVWVVPYNNIPVFLILHPYHPPRSITIVGALHAISPITQSSFRKEVLFIKKNYKTLLIWVRIKQVNMCSRKLSGKEECEFRIG
jgi:hypothetical protein